MRFNGSTLNLPAEWNFLPLKRVTRFGYGEALASDDRDPMGEYKVFGSNGAFDQHSTANTEAPCIIVGRKGSYGKLQFSDSPVFAVDTTFIVDSRYTSNDLRYLYYALGVLGLDELSDDTAVPGLSREKAYAALCPLPPFEAQKRITVFLDEKTARIDGLIEKKQALLERLAEKRQAIITQAVTKGLNRAAPMKDSGIDWLGQIPVHWEVKRLKYITPRVTVGIVVTPAAYYADEGVLALRGLNIKTMDFDLSDVRYISEEGHKLNAKSTLSKDDLVAVRTGAPGTTAIVPPEMDGCNCIDLVIVRKPLSAEPRYLGWFLNSDIAKVQYTMGSEGALQQHFNVETSKEVIVTLPPRSEQSALVESIDTKLRLHDEQTSLVNQSVEKLTEYRAALITAAVTGQIERLR